MKDLFKLIRNQSSDLDYLKRFGLGGPESVRDVCPNISGTKTGTDKRSTVLERSLQAGSESVIRSRLSQTVRILRTKNRIASHLPEGCELWPQVLASRRLQIRKKVLLLQSFSILWIFSWNLLWVWRNQSRSLENNCLSRDIQFAHRVFFQCPLSKQKCIQKNEARMAQIQIWWIPRRIPLTF